MSVLSLERIEEIAADPARRTAPVPPAAPDRSRPFVPESFTQLYYAPCYRELSLEERIRYNQLFGLRINEYIMMLERDFVDPVLKSLRGRAARRGSPALARTLEGMLIEEEKHYEAFAALNRRCEPQDYSASDWHFMRLRWHERAVLRGMQSLARWLPFALWIIIAMEEFSICLASAMARGEDELGPLDAHFVKVHREHAKDEARHVHIDVHLIRTCLASLPAAWRAMNARLFMAVMRDMMTPKAGGTGARVIHRLVREFPRLESRRARMVAELIGLGSDERFQRSLFGRAQTPLSFAAYDEEPAFERLGEVLRSYERPHTA
jgi:hypothetical protein